MTTLRNFHVPLPEELYRQLREEAERLRQPATHVVRQAIQSWLDRQHQDRLYEAIQAYAREQAGSEADLDPALEAAALEHLTDLEQDGN
jgi:Arc/MetJ-type ribon-helix-helix transcriptional regulator